MSLNKIQIFRLENIIKGYFMPTLSLLLASIGTFFYISNFKFDWIIPTNVVLPVILVISYIVFWIWFSHSAINSRLGKTITATVPDFLIVTLIAIFLSIFENQPTLHWLSQIRIPLAVLGTLLSIFMISVNNTQKLASANIKNEGPIDTENSNNFHKEKSRADHIPLLGSVIRWCRNEGWVNCLALFLILSLFTCLKLPFLDVSFTGEHSMKYNSYVEPAIYMVQHETLFWNQSKYTAEPVNNPQGIYTTFGHLPLTSWGLAITYRILPQIPLELSTRLFTNLLGILILISAYLFFRSLVGKKPALFIIFFLAINPIILFFTFVTVEDSWAILFMFISLIFLGKWLRTNDTKYLFWSGILFGIGNESKYTLFLWYAPIIASLILSVKKEALFFIKNYSIIIGLGILPIIAEKTSIRYLPQYHYLAVLALGVWVLIFTALYKSRVIWGAWVEKVTQFVLKKRTTLLGAAILAAVSGLVFIKTTGISGLSGEFFTDGKLILNFKMYSYMLNNQFAQYMTKPAFYFGLLGFIATVFLTRKLDKFKILIISFFAGSLFYWITASKVIFFHNYYTSIIMILFSISAGLLAFMISNSFPKKIQSVVGTLLILLTIFIPSYKANTTRLKQERSESKEAASYLAANTGPNDIYIDESYALTLTILTGRSRIEPSSLLESPLIKQSISSIGFSNTMAKYNIRYLITNNKTPDLDLYANLFSDTALESVSYRRTDLILAKLNPDYSYFQDSNIRDKIIESNDLQDKFVLEKTIGSYNFFRFQN